MKDNFFPIIAAGVLILASSCSDEKQKQVRLDFRPHWRVCSHGEMITNPEDTVDGELDPSLELSECTFVPQKIIDEIQKAKAQEECKPGTWTQAQAFMPKHKGCKRYEKLRGLSVETMKHLRTLECGNEGFWPDLFRKISGKRRCQIFYKTVQDAGQMMFPGIKTEEDQE
ncbi:MAG: hypothetical protein JNL01_07175 [Bdellovibrionales bacterium]|nr:hypothetical protein [Bdellovibrionales bacterium]